MPANRQTKICAGSRAVNGGSLQSSYSAVRIRPGAYKNMTMTSGVTGSMAHFE